MHITAENPEFIPCLQFCLCSSDAKLRTIIHGPSKRGAVLAAVPSVCVSVFCGVRVVFCVALVFVVCCCCSDGLDLAVSVVGGRVGQLSADREHMDNATQHDREGRTHEETTNTKNTQPTNITRRKHAHTQTTQRPDCARLAHCASASLVALAPSTVPES